MGIFNLFGRSRKVLTTDNEIGKKISWKDSINIVFKIVDFDSNGTSVDHLGNVHSKNMYEPYGYLSVNNPNYTGVLKLPIIHKDDYLLVEQYFTNTQLKKIIDDKDFLVVYRPREITPEGLAGIYHCLHYVITPQGTFTEFFKKYGCSSNEVNIEKLFIKFSWDMVKVETNETPFN